MNEPTFKNRRSTGFTLVEILVVLVIAAIVISIAIPKIRTVNKERNLREAARVVGSAFANASQRAVIDGVAGIRISRNPNLFLSGTTQQFAASEISILRRVPNYVGDQVYEPDHLDAFGMPDDLGASKLSATTVEIPLPIEHDPGAGRLIVRSGDSISFNNSNVRFQISSADINGTMLDLTLDVEADSYPKLPDTMDDVPFVVFRQPQILRSSRTTLPDNYIVDLRFSGFEIQDGFDTTGSFVPPYTTRTVRDRQLTRVFEPAPTDFHDDPMVDPFFVVENYDIEFIFDDDGAIDRVIYIEIGDEDMDGTAGERIVRQPLGPIYLLVTEIPTSQDATQAVATADEEAFWVTVSNNNGATNIGYNDANDSQGLTLADFSEFYFAELDPTNMNDRDRDRFNQIINASRGRSATVAAGQ